ncbi:MAG: PorV/PorQ family protein [Elusimicrobia bacterium]|nr:PorV/PorQ family protein [Elusimicrobiota bacterium]
MAKQAAIHGTPRACNYKGRASLCGYWLLITGYCCLLLFTIHYSLFTAVYAGEPGTAAASFLKFPAGSRPTAMGEAYTALSEDIYAGWWNPAGFGSIEFPEIGATYNASFQDVAHQYLSFAYPLKYGSTLGLNLIRLGVAPFQGYDAQGAKTRSVESSDYSIGAGYGYVILKDEVERPLLNAGINFKMIQEKLDSVSASAFAVDVGAIYSKRPAYYWTRKAPGQEFKFGLALKNIGTGLKYDRLSFPLPWSINLGAAWLGHVKNNEFALSLDQSISKDDKYRISLGVEYIAFNILALRAGYKTGQETGSGIRAGVGFKFSIVNLDYAFAPFGELGQAHRIGFSMKLGTQGFRRHPTLGKWHKAETGAQIVGEKTATRLELFAEDFLALAKKDFQARNYPSALDNIVKAGSLEPKLLDGEWGDKEKRLGQIVKGMKFREMPKKLKILARQSNESNLAHESIEAYMEGKNTKAFLLAEASFGTNQIKDSVFEEYLNLTSRLAEIEIRREEILPKPALIKEKFKKAAAAFYLQKFDVSVKELLEIALIDETNELAWTRLGSAYFAAGDKEKSKATYQKVLEMNPYNKSVLEFMKIQGWK